MVNKPGHDWQAMQCRTTWQPGHAAQDAIGQPKWVAVSSSCCSDRCAPCVRMLAAWQRTNAGIGVTLPGSLLAASFGQTGDKDWPEDQPRTREGGMILYRAHRMEMDRGVEM